ncbi:hypothetical protein LPTSP3_g11740 [Leptospira kobayashii]|uniref:TIGR04388 family protein n=1 Tax=Leptospira kobayashii TaxID=1917830 RepID=A0ABN6KBC8_9LEPT|nr:TIGR04388 family protein [Leptospira kobayashii]BDA78244.1 hypothetical protein LPTSP3_g11740 [Leptospira kobayashii]
MFTTLSKKVKPSLQEETLSVAEDSYSLTTKIQASLSLFAFLFSLLFAGSIASQEVIPQLQMEAYNSNLMNQVYGQSYFLNSLSAWTDQVTYYKGVLRAYWEAAADDAIYNYVDSITTSDAFNSVDAYKDYVFKELDSQKIAALNIWENQANLQLLENRNEFVLKLNTDRVDQSYLSRLGIQGTFNQPQDPNASTQELQRQIASAANNWNTNFNQSYQAGLNDFANSLNTIQNKYDSFLQSMNDSEATFTDNLSAIDSYKTVVKDAIRGMVGQFQGMIDQPCNQATSCLYRDGNNGGLNTAGQTLNDLVARLNTVLNNQNLDSSNVLTTISSEINSFLSNQTNAARLTQIDYSNQVTTTQTSLNPPSTYGLGNVSSLITAVNNGTLSFYDLQSSQTSQWRVDTSGIFSGIVDPFIETMIRSITNGNSANIKGIIESQIGGGRTATVLATNVYTDWNGGSNGDGWAYFRALNTEMNLNRDGAATWNWGAERFIVSPPAYWINWFQMGRIGYQVVYEMYDPNAQALATYWNGNYTSLNGQLAQYQNNITPAIGNWESQVASYNSFYEQWKTSADALKAQAQADYENSMADLESKKSAWLNQMEAERNAGLNQWDQLYSNASSSGGQNAQSVASSIQAVNSSVSSGINIATGTQSILDNYNNKLDTLASTEFTFTDTTKRYEPALADTGIQKQLDPFAQIGNLGADYSIGNITKGELGNKLAFSGGIKQAFNDISDSTIRYGIGASTGGFSNGTFGSLQQAAFNSTGITPKNTDVAGGETSFTTQKFSILGAANEKKIDTSLSVDGKDLTEVFGKTANGVYQYSQLLSLNENNSSAAKAEQEKAVNQMAYQVNWDSKWSAKLDETGSLKLNGTIGNLSNQEVTDILKKLSTYEYKGLKFDQFCIAGTTDYAACQAEEQRMSKLQSDDYKAKFQSDIDKLAAQGYEIQNGMIVKSLSREDKIRLGQTEGLTLTDTEKQTASVCYVDPSKCKDLLKQEFTISYDKTGGVTLSKIISNGSIGGTNNAGQYISGTQTESRYISLSKVAPVVAPKGTDLFAEWGQDVWNDIDTQASQVMNDFYTKSLAQDSKMLTQATSVIRDVESKNEKLFQQKKAVQEETDEMIKELVMAYISGGMAGVTASIKSQIEDKINSGLAEAFIRGTGGSEADIQKVADLISLIRGRMQADKMKKRANTMSISNPIRSLENMVSKSFSTVMEVANNVTFGAAGAVLAVGTGIVTKVAGVVSDTIGSVTKALGPLGNTIGAILSPTTMLAAEATKKAADYIGEQSEKMLGAKNAMSEIKANEESIIKNYASQAIATATGIPPEVATTLVNDYVGSQKAKKARRAANANPLGNIGSQVVGAVGGIIKTAAVAFGAKERDIQEMLSDGNKILYSGNLDVTADELRSEAYANQMFGMKLGALSYTSSTPKDKEGIVEELGQRMVVDQLAAATGWDKDVTNALFRKEYGRIKQKKADKKAQNAAIKSTVITAVTTAATLGAAGALGSVVRGAMSSIGTAFGASANVAANVGAAVIKGAVQVVDGARNGWEGALAGAANGALGMVTAGAFQGNSIADALRTASEKVGLGLGVTYDKDTGWGGSIGLGNKVNNASFSFSQRGPSSVSLSSGGPLGTQLTINHTTGGTSTVGVSYNAGKGPRDGLNISANYDLDGGGVSGGLSYTDSKSKVGLSLNASQNGLSSSLVTNGVNIGTNTSNGFQMAEMNWAQDNINAAQNLAVASANTSSLGNVLRNIPLLGGLLGAGGDIISGTFSAAADVVTLGQAGSFRAGLSELGKGLFNMGDILVRDIAALGMGLFGTSITTLRDITNILTLGLIPELGNYDPELKDMKPTYIHGAIARLIKDAVILDYGSFGGANWGTDYFGQDQSMQINQGDVASFHHDNDMNEIDWIKRNWTTTPSKQWVGPIGAAYTLIGTPLFAIIGLLEGEHKPAAKVTANGTK